MLGRLYGIKMFGRLYGIFKAAKTHKAFKRPSALSPNTRLCHTWYYFNTILDNISTQSLILFQHNTWALFQHNIQHYFNTKPDTISKQYLNALSMQYLVLFQHNAQCVWCILFFIKNQPFTTQYNVTCSNVSLTHIIQSNTRDDGGDLGGDLGAHFVEDW